MKRLPLCALLLLFVLPACGNAQNLSPEETLRKNFPKINFESVKPTQIKGIYEVQSGNQILYFMPEAEVIIAGSIITKDGVNLTRESNLKRMAAKMADLPLGDALKIGRGKTKVVKFTDPNCPYCRQAFQYFAGRKDVTLYVFLIPLSQDSERKIKHIFCSGNREKAYEEALSGKLDGNASLNLCQDQKIDELINNHRQIAQQAGVRATPTFYIKGKAVDGFDKKMLEDIIGN